MQKLLFTELLEMVRESFGGNTADAILLATTLPPGGVYTASRTPSRAGMAALFDQLQHHTGLPLEELSAGFGRHLCKRITHAYPQYKGHVSRIFTALGKRGDTPVFECLLTAGGRLTVLYDPYAKVACLADGALKGYLAYLQELSNVEETIISDGRRKVVVTLN